MPVDFSVWYADLRRPGPGWETPLRVFLCNATSPYFGKSNMIAVSICLDGGPGVELARENMQVGVPLQTVPIYPSTLNRSLQIGCA